MQEGKDLFTFCFLQLHYTQTAWQVLDSEKLITCTVCKMFLVWSSEGGWNGTGYVLHMGRSVMQTKFRSGKLERKRQCEKCGRLEEG